MPFFSIVTVCLNAGDDLNVTVKSALSQIFTDLEIIIKDGGSNDGSLSKLTDDNRIRLFIQKDSGIYDAMNQALQYVTGRFLLYLNAGDTFNSSFDLLRIHNEINQNQGNGLYYCDYKTTFLNKRVYSPQKLYEFTLFRNMLCHQCCFFEINNFKATGFFNTNYKIAADYEFLLRFIIINKFSSKYIDLLGIIYKSGGYAFANQKLAKQEVNLIRYDIFGSKYYVYNLLLKITLPTLRNHLMYSGNYFIKNVYLSIANIINRKI